MYIVSAFDPMENDDFMDREFETEEEAEEYLNLKQEQYPEYSWDIEEI